MRFGQNPLKYTKKEIESPAEITVGVLNYIPEQTGYFQGQFDALKLCLASIRSNADQAFDLLLVDNGSCQEVQHYLTDELKAGRITYLILNERNICKANAQMQILRSSPGDLVFYSDGDIYYRPGWMQTHLQVLKYFPEAGIVGGIPLRNLAYFHTAPSRCWAEENQSKLLLEKGDLIPESWTRDFLSSVGDERFIDNWINNEDWRVTRGSTTAYIGASHMQFLIPRNVIELIPHHRFGMALSPIDDQYLDDTIESSGFLRLSTDHPTVYHIGNTITEDWLLEEYHRLVENSEASKTPERSESNRKDKSALNWLWRRRRILNIIKAIHEWTFKVYYENV
ncbi:MAG: glycosyltransferase [Chloroflexi bacterium]|nr:glycosyltransferase [Chloroflexota bacterium]